MTGPLAHTSGPGLISWDRGALGPLGLWPKTKAFGLGYGPRSNAGVLDQDIGPWHRTLVLDLDLGSLVRDLGLSAGTLDQGYGSLDQ